MIFIRFILCTFYKSLRLLNGEKNTANYVIYEFKKLNVIKGGFQVKKGAYLCFSCKYAYAPFWESLTLLKAENNITN